MKLDKVIKDLEGMKKAGFVTCNIQCFLDELEKVTKSVEVDQFIADWYETYKDNLEYSLWEWMRYEPNREKNKKFYLWLNDASNNPVETLVKMKLYGYKVKKVKRYLVKLKGVACPYLNHDTINELWFYNQKIEGAYNKTHHTREELRDVGFDWVFNCPGIEIEEVEE